MAVAVIDLAAVLDRVVAVVSRVSIFIEKTTVWIRNPFLNEQQLIEIEHRHTASGALIEHPSPAM
eukprot:IDg16077t1